MHIEHHRQVGLLLSLRQGQVAVNSQPVPAGEGDRFHGCERILVQFWLVVEEKRCFLAFPIVGVKRHRPIVNRERYYPGRIGVVTTNDEEVSLMDAANVVKIHLDGLI